MPVTSIFPLFPTMLSLSFDTSPIFGISFYLFSANAFNLDQSKNLTPGKYRYSLYGRKQCGKRRKQFGKRRKCRLPAFSPLPMMFSKGFFPKQALVFKCLHYKSFENALGKGEIGCNKQFLLFPVFFTHLENFLPFSSNMKLSSSNSFSLEESRFVVWERVKNRNYHYCTHSN